MTTYTVNLGTRPSDFLAPDISFISASATNLSYPPGINIDFATEPADGQTVYGYVNGVQTGSVTVTEDWIIDGRLDGLEEDLFGTIDDGEDSDLQVRHGSSSLSNTIVVTRDSAAPTISSPSASAINALAVTGSITTIENDGTVFFGVYADGSSAPTGAQIEAGTGTGYVAKTSMAGGTAGSKTSPSMPVSANTAYDVYITHKDIAGNYATPQKADVTTPVLIWNLVGHGKENGASDPVATTAFNSVGANLITVQTTEYDGGGANLSLSDGVNTFTEVSAVRQHPSGYYHRFWECISPSTSATHQITANKGSAGGVDIIGITAQAWTKTTGTPTRDVTASANGTGTSQASGSVTPTANNALIISSVGGATPIPSATHEPSGFTLVNFQEGESAVNYTVAAAYYPQSTIAAINPTWTYDVSSGTSVSTVVYK